MFVNFFSMFGLIYHYTAHLTAFRGIHLRVSKIEQRILQVVLEYSSVLTGQQGFFSNSFSRTYILQLLTIFGNFEFLGTKFNLVKRLSGSF